MKQAAAVLSLFLLAGVLSAADLESIKRQPDLEKRSKEALEFASGSVPKVVKAYHDAQPEAARAILAEIVEAVELSKTSLDETGKQPRKSPKHFKRAEIETRKLLDDLEGAKRKLTFDERPDLEPVIERIDEINRELLLGIMERK